MVVFPKRNWVKVVFPKYRKEMKGIQWGFLYNEFKDKKFDHKKLEEEITKLMQDEDDVPLPKERPEEEKGLSQEEIEEIEYEKASLDNESIDDIFSSVEEIDEIPIVSVDSKKNKKE